MMDLAESCISFQEAKHMSRNRADFTDDSLQRQRALARRENEGGASPPSLQPDATPIQDPRPANADSDTELDGFHCRLIVLESPSDAVDQ